MKNNYVLTDSEYKDICALVYDNTGIILNEEKRKLAYSRFSRRLKDLKLTTFREYCDIVRSGDKREMTHFANAITTNLTSFFREAHHFDRLVDEVMPGLLKKTSRKIRIWSAGCSTGEEPYSLGIAILKKYPDIKNWDIKILATDLDSKVLETASRGIYKSQGLNTLDDPTIAKECFKRGLIDGVESVQVSSEVRELIQFKKLNLMDKTWPMKGSFDVIFCRNVVIYFDQITQQKLFSSFSKLQNKGDYLFIGHSETLKGFDTPYKNIGRTVYIKEN
ncbi:MAG: protein-glutamate O-methyltransferase CheR [Gammaproteobacteria bacterium]